jgi:thiol-disulfide isomerase/thioredoxin
MSARAVPVHETRRPEMGVIGFAVVLVVMLAVAAFVVSKVSSSSGSSSSLRETRPVSITAGASGYAPVVKGAAFDGSAVTLANDGRAKLIMFVAHWCPHCRAEVPKVTEWIRSGDVTEAVDLYAVSTSVNPNAVNYPPSAWLAKEGWPVTTMADNSQGSVASAFGVTGFPYFVAVAPDGRIVGRDSGELPTTKIQSLLDSARTGQVPAS